MYCWSSAITDHICALDSRFLSCFLVGDSIVPKVTNRLVVDYLCWSGRVLLAGVFPHTDFYGNPWPPGSWREAHAGQALAGPFGACFASVSHDEKARKDTHCFKQWYSCNRICESCSASQNIASHSHGNNRGDAPWRADLVSDEAYLRDTPADDLSPWISMPGYQLSRALHDLMHGVHLGTGKDFCAQLIFDLCKHGYVPGDSLQAKLSAVWREFRLYCKRHRITHPKRRLTAAVIGLKPDSPNSDYPEMNGRTKASHVKPLIHFLAWRWKRALAPKFRKPSDVHCLLRAWCTVFLTSYTVLTPAVFLWMRFRRRGLIPADVFFYWHGSLSPLRIMVLSHTKCARKDTIWITFLLPWCRHGKTQGF